MGQRQRKANTIYDLVSSFLKISVVSAALIHVQTSDNLLAERKEN